MSDEKAWVVVHCEVFQVEPSLFIDELVFHSASTKKKAEEFIKNVAIERIAWWKILEFTVDNPNWLDDADSTSFYGDKGKKLKKAPIDKAKKEFLKANSLEVK